MNFFFRIYAKLFARPIFIKVHKLMYQLSLRGLGVFNLDEGYLSGEKYWLRRYLKGKDSPIVLDVGANKGGYSKDVIEANDSSIIFAFEPHPETYNNLMQEDFGHSRFKSFNVGVGDKKGCLDLYDYSEKDGSAHASFYQGVISDLHKGNAISHRVEVVKIDDVLSEEGVEQVDLLKIDTEGNEYNVLKGACDSIKKGKIRAIHFEFNEMNIISEVNFKMFWDFLEQYNFYRILPDGNFVPIKSYSPMYCEIYGYQNIVCLLR